MKKVVLVTGSSRGIGKETIIKYSQNNFDVVINYCNDSSLDKCIELKEYVESNYNNKALIIKCDVSNEESVKHMIDEIIDLFGRLDVVVNNAGICNDSVFLDKTADSFRRILDVNLIGPFLVSKYASQVMNEGSIINVSSTNGIDTLYPESMDYDSSKAGVISLTKNLATLLSPKIRVNCVCPGWVNTDMNKYLDLEFINQEINKITLGRFGECSEIANVIYFLSSDEASYVNGSIIRVDGGVK